jgi:hypothetical protein
LASVTAACTAANASARGFIINVSNPAIRFDITVLRDAMCFAMELIPNQSPHNEKSAGIIILPPKDESNWIDAGNSQPFGWAIAGTPFVYGLVIFLSSFIL